LGPLEVLQPTPRSKITLSAAVVLGLFAEATEEEVQDHEPAEEENGDDEEEPYDAQQ
jgi:hypothetical protein